MDTDLAPGTNGASYVPCQKGRRHVLLDSTGVLSCALRQAPIQESDCTDHLVVNVASMLVHHPLDSVRGTSCDSR